MSAFQGEPHRRAASYSVTLHAHIGEHERGKTFDPLESVIGVL